MTCKHKKNIFLKLSDYIWSLFLNGLLIILPITITAVIFNISFKFITSWLEPVKAIQPKFLKSIPHAEIIIVIISIFLIGTILKIFLLRKIIHAIEDIIERIPIIRPIYSGTKQLVRAFGKKDQITFRKVVMLQFPKKDIYCIGFLTSELPEELAPVKNEKFFNIFIPTTPNPTSGYFAVVPQKEVIILNITRQEAMSLIISGGIIQPRRFEKQDKST